VVPSNARTRCQFPSHVVLTTLFEHRHSLFTPDSPKISNSASNRRLLVEDHGGSERKSSDIGDDAAHLRVLILL
jgi:hypothetical protein